VTITGRLRSLIGPPTRAPRRGIRRAVGLLNSLGSRRECLLCGWSGYRFEKTGHGKKRRSDARCPRCWSVERHRLAHILLRGQIAPGQRTLHVAPEPSVARWLKSISDDYLSIDLEGEKGMQAMDLTSLDLPDASRSLIFCSHVLEHIPDDRAALAEMRRVVEPGGIAVIQVPIQGERTDEDATVTAPAERARRFGQADHVRSYGIDMAERLVQVGFRVDVLDQRGLAPSVIDRHRLVARSTCEVFVCRRI
jgi:SAM-dependent methyltransferase